MSHDSKFESESNENLDKKAFYERPERPVLPKVDFDSIPQELKDHPYWCLWTFEWITKKDGTGGKWNKRPLTITPSDQKCREETGLCYWPAKTSNPKHGWTFDRVRREYELSVDKKWVAGVGVFLRSGLCGIDLDDSIKPDGTIKKWGAKTIEELDSYTETSPSGKGFKTLLYASMDKLRECEQVAAIGDAGLPHRTVFHDGEIEVYDSTSPRFFTVTGNRHGYKNSIEERQEPFDLLYLEAFEESLIIAAATRTAATGSTREPGEVTADDQEVLSRARGAANGDRFIKLYDRGDLADYDADQSRADLGLCGMLAFWCGPDVERIDRLFRASKLHREKWDDREDYRNWTLTKAITRGDFFDWSKTQPADTSGDRVHEFFEGKDPWEDCEDDYRDPPRENAEDRHEKSMRVDAGISNERIARYRDNLKKKNITIIDELDGDPYILQTLCPCCALDGFFSVSHRTASYECAAGKKSWRAGALMYSRKKGEIELLTLADVLNQDDETYLIEDHLTTDILAQIYGPPGVTKSFACFDMAMCVGSGKPYLDKYPVMQSKVVYLYAEGFGGLKKRLRAWCHQYPDADLDAAMKNVYFIKVPIDFTQEMPTDGFVELIDAHEVNPKFIVIDTLNRNFGGDENSTADMSAFVRNVDSVRDRYKATTLVVHHTGKDASKQGRGNSALLGGITTSIKLEGADKVGEHFQSVVLSFDKVKDGNPSLRYKMAKTEIQYGDRKGDHSLVLLQSDEEPAPATPTKVDQTDKEFLLRDMKIMHNEIWPDSVHPYSKSHIAELMKKKGADMEQLATGNGKVYKKISRGRIGKMVNWLTWMGHFEKVASKNPNKHLYRRITDHCDFNMVYGPPEVFVDLDQAPVTDD